MPPSSADNVVALPVAVPEGPGRQKRGRYYELDFLPAAVEILETPASPLGRSVALAISLFAAIAILWACVGEIDIVAVAQGKIVPVGRTKIVQAPALDPGESGVVKTIAVEEGQHVTAASCWWSSIPPRRTRTARRSPNSSRRLGSTSRACARS
jgi:hemolysin D